MKINKINHPWCYWIIQGKLGNDTIVNRTWNFCSNPVRGGVLTLCHELGWDGGTIHQVINELENAILEVL